MDGADLCTIGGSMMLTVHVHIQVKPDQVEAFKAACIENSRNSLQELGIARFDVLQQQDDPTRFLLVEVYRSAEAPAAHKQTAHYREWAEAVAEMMAVPRSSVKFDRVYPEAGLPCRSGSLPPDASSSDAASRSRSPPSPGISAAAP